MGLVLHRLSIFLLLTLFTGSMPVGMAADFNRNAPSPMQIKKTLPTKPATVKARKASPAGSLPSSSKTQPAKVPASGGVIPGFLKKLGQKKLAISSAGQSKKVKSPQTINMPPLTMTGRGLRIIEMPPLTLTGRGS
ncbi:MAG: hypothetical protein Q9M29_09055 [Mariprofundaceae bacterium]|nr:hypothetical protein [Mariprofundaceae bacterium]